MIPYIYVDVDHKFTKLIRTWLDKPAKQRDFNEGALYLLKLTGNHIMYRNLVVTPNAQKMEFLEYQLQKYYNFRVQNLTNEQVKDMSAEVEKIVEEHIPLATEADKAKRGRRDDHEDLPDEIKALYVENLSLLQRMRELHLRLRSLSLENAPCPDSERYPSPKELIALDKKLHKNWDQYDHYVIDRE